MVFQYFLLSNAGSYRLQDGFDFIGSHRDNHIRSFSSEILSFHAVLVITSKRAYLFVQHIPSWYFRERSFYPSSVYLACWWYYNVIWEISEQVFRSTKSFGAIGISAEGIFLDKGFYKIAYTLCNIKPPGRIALLTSAKEFIKLIAYHSYYGGNDEKINRHSSEVYMKVNSASLIGLTGDFGNFRPEGIEGISSVTIHKLKIRPK